MRMDLFADSSNPAFHGADGLIEKRGGGTLSLGFVEPVTAGTIKVDEGRLEVSESAPAAIGAIRLERLELAAGTTVKIPSGGMTVANLKASDGAKVEGPGTLTVTSSMIGVPGLVNGAVLRATTPNFASREYVFSGMTPWFDLDASDFGTDKMTTELENGTNFVTRWEDSCGGGHYAVQYLTSDKGGKCWIREDATNGMPFVDLGPFTSTNNTAPGVMDAPNRALKICPPAEIDSSGKGYSVGLEASSWEGLKKPAIKAAFFAVSSDNGGGSLLGAAGANYMQYGLIHGKGGADAPIICFEKSTWNSQWYVDYSKDSYIDNGTTVFRVNGRSVYPRSEPFSGGYDVITFRGSRESCLLGTFWQSGSKDYENSANGLAYGEVICFTNTITTAQMENIEIYLQNKWYGRRAPGCFYEGAVLLEDGSTLDVSAGSDGAVVATTLGGIGTVAGNVIFAENGVFRVDLDATGAPVTDITVNGQLSLPARASVEFAGDVRKLKAGTYTLLSATTCAGSPSAWTFGAGSGGKSYKMRRTGNGLELAVIPRGINIIFR